MRAIPFARVVAALAATAAATIGLVGVSSPAHAEPVVLGTLSLDPRSGPVGSPSDLQDTNPMLVSATTTGACPEGFGAFAGIWVGAVGGPYQILDRLGSDFNYDQVPSVTLGSNRSMAAALGATPADGTYEVVIECSSFEATHPLRYSTLIAVAGGTWQVVDAEDTRTKLVTNPTFFQLEGRSVRLTAKVNETEAAGEVEFFTGTTSLGTATVAGGRASITTTTLPAGLHRLTTSFTPDDPRLFGASTSRTVFFLVLDL